ncbi:MAG: hypothetical protein FWE53_05415 [Firmicutes bacterium]|nr:hypothetical protein [Bacillota bacterium]
MKIKPELLQAYLAKEKMTISELAEEMEVAVAEIEKLLAGEAVCERTAYQFVYYLGADEAQKYIDWQALGKKNPLINEVAVSSDEKE